LVIYGLVNIFMKLKFPYIQYSYRTKLSMINIRSGRESDSDAELEHAEKLRQVKAVLEEVPFIKLNLIFIVNLVLFFCF
jgi:hypothetical protein